MMTSTEAKLLGCPFCGSAAEHFHHHDHGGWSNTDSVSCLNEDCGCGTCLHETKERAIAAWNRRALSASLPGDVAGLVERLRVNAKSWRREDALVARDESEADLADEAAAALTAMSARLAEAMKVVETRADWHKCSCPEPCDDYGVFPGGCAGRYAQDYRDIARAFVNREGE